jgi:hypothetical protein
MLVAAVFFGSLIGVMLFYGCCDGTAGRFVGGRKT